MKIKNIILASMLALSVAACGTVDAGERGVFTSFGTVSEAVEPGLHWYNPITTSLETISVNPLKWDSKSDAYTSDFQTALITFTLTYQLSPSKARSTYIEAKDTWAERYVPSATESSIKQVVGTTTAIQLIQKRSIVENMIKDVIRQKLAIRGIVISEFAITNIDFSEAFEEAVNRKQIAVEDAATAKNKTVEVTEKATQTVIAAKADAEAIQIKSQALANNPGLAQYEAVQKWDGALPQNMYGNAAIPFIGVK